MRWWVIGLTMTLAVAAMASWLGFDAAATVAILALFGAATAARVFRGSGEIVRDTAATMRRPKK